MVDGRAESHDTHINTVTMDDVGLYPVKSAVVQKNSKTWSSEYVLSCFSMVRDLLTKHLKKNIALNNINSIVISECASRPSSATVSCCPIPIHSGPLVSSLTYGYYTPGKIVGKCWIVPSFHSLADLHLHISLLHNDS